MHPNSNKKPSHTHPGREYTNIQQQQQQRIGTDINLIRRSRHYSSELYGNRSNSENKLFRSPSRSRTRHEAKRPLNQENRCSSRRQFDDVILVNITDQHTTNANWKCGQKKMKKGAMAKKGQKVILNSSPNRKTIVRAKHNVKDNIPNTTAKTKKNVVVTCSCKIRTSDIARRNVEDTIKSAINNAADGDPIKNALHLTDQIKTNIDNIRAQSSKCSPLRGLPQSKYVISSKKSPEFRPNSVLITAPYLQQLKSEINSNRPKCPPSCISHVDQDIFDLRNEILQYKLKSEQDLPQAMVIEVSYINENKDSETVQKKQTMSKQFPLSCEVTCDKYTECQHNCQHLLIDYSKIAEKKKPQKFSDDSIVSLQPSTDRFSTMTLNDSDISQNQGIKPVSVTDKKVSSMRKMPRTDNGTERAFDKLDPDPVRGAWHKVSTIGNPVQNERPKLTAKDLPLIGGDAVLNESFLRDQIAGMQKIDKLVEEAEQSIGKVVKGFDKYFKEPRHNPSQPMELELKRKNIEFNIDYSCDCSSILRCDCEAHEGSETSFLSQTLPSFDHYDVLTSDPLSDSDHLNTISERTETNAVTISQSEGKTPFSETTIEDQLSEKHAAIPINKRHIVHLPPIIIPIAKAPMRLETGTETDSIFNRVLTNVLEIQTLPGVEIRPSFKVQKIYNINIKPTCCSTDESNVEHNKNSTYIEIKHEDPVFVQMVDSTNNPVMRASQKNSDFSTASSSKKSGRQHKIGQEITVLKAPNPAMRDVKSVAQTCCRRIDKNSRKYLQDKSTITPQQKDEAIEELLGDMERFQIPMVSVTGNSSISNTSSEYIVVQDDETQVSIKSSRCKQRTKSTCSDKSPKTPPQKSLLISIGNNTSVNTFPTNVRPPIPGLPFSAYLPLPYDNEEIEEILISAEPLEGSDIMPYDLMNIQNSRAADVEMGNCLSQCPTKQPSCEFTLETCSLTALKLAQKKNVPDKDDAICLANAYDFNPAREGSSNCVNVPPHGCQETFRNNEVSPNSSSNSVDFTQFQTKPAYDNISMPSVSFAAGDRDYSASAIDLQRTSSILSPPLFNEMDIEGVQIMAPSGNVIAMPTLIEYDKRSVAQSLDQNLLLAQLKDNAPPTIAYHKLPFPYVESTSTETFSHSSGDYPQRHKFLVRAKRRKAYQRGIVTDDEGDFILSRSPDRGDPMSDGEMTQYTSSTGEVIPIGPDLLKNRNFMRRRPDRIFQKELMQRDMHIQRQYNYFNNWVSYYVSANQPMRR